MNIFRADTSHIPLIRDLTMQVWPQTYTPIIGADQVAYMLDRFYNPDALSAQMNEQGHQFIIGEVDGKPAAFASYSEVEPGVFKLHKLYTTLAAQGKGLGRALVDYIVADIRVKNANMLRLNVNIHNHAAKKFYARYGFRHLLDEDIDIGSSFFMNDHVLCLNIYYHTA